MSESPCMSCLRQKWNVRSTGTCMYACWRASQTFDATSACISETRLQKKKGRVWQICDRVLHTNWPSHQTITACNASKIPPWSQLQSEHNESFIFIQCNKFWHFSEHKLLQQILQLWNGLHAQQDQSMAFHSPTFIKMINIPQSKTECSALTCVHGFLSVAGVAFGSLGV